MIADPIKIISRPDEILVKAGRCGRWKRDSLRCDSGLPTRKQEALSKIEVARGEGKTPAQLEALARKLVTKARNSGARCKMKVKPRGSACRLHGGKSLGGVESPTFKLGEYSIKRHLRPDQKEAYEAWLNDPHRFDHARQGAGLEVLLVNQFSRLRAPALAEWKLIAEGWALIQEAARVANSAVEGAQEKAVLLQGQGLATIGKGVSGYKAEIDNDAAVRSTAKIIVEQSRVTARENTRAHREQEVISLQQHTAQRAREIEVFWRAIESETRGMKDKDAKLVRGALLAGVSAWREEGDRWTETPNVAIN